jgi:hypothetical protein
VSAGAVVCPWHRTSDATRASTRTAPACPGTADTQPVLTWLTVTALQSAAAFPCRVRSRDAHEISVATQSGPD